ncbi:MAG: right-handed parallel beta-helix repeat-containing protein [Gemmatimonadaceae bacterium]
MFGLTANASVSLTSIVGMIMKRVLLLLPFAFAGCRDSVTAPDGSTARLLAPSKHVVVTPSCTTTPFQGFTAALVNPTTTVSGSVNAQGCDIGVYYDNNGPGGTVKGADISLALRYGVIVNGDNGPVAVDVINSSIHDIGDSPLNGNQRGVGIYYRAFLPGGSATGKISGNTLANYQKGGIVVNGIGSNVVVSGNTVTGQGPVNWIAQNGIQFGYGSSGSAMKNTVTGHSYTGSSTASGGIIVVGGPGYGTCPDGPCLYTTGIQIVQNIVTDNDIGVWLSNLAEDYSAPLDATNVKAVNNTISSSAIQNGICYQAGVADQGNNDKVINNLISGTGYAPSSTCYAVPIDADPLFTNRPKVHANK